MGALLTALAVGVLVGAAMGALGGGGGILAIPALVHLLGLPVAQASATSLVVVGLTSLVGVAQHGRAGRVRVREGLTFVALGVAGSVVGSRLALRTDPGVVLALLGVLLLVVASLMWRRAGRGSDGARDQAPSAHPGTGSPRWPLIVAAATVVGLLTGFFGVGGGFAVVPALVLALGLPMREAVGTSLLVIAGSSAVALASRLGSGLQLDLPLVAAFTASAMAASLVAGRLAADVPAHQLQRAFAGLLVVVAALTLGQGALT